MKVSPKVNASGLVALLTVLVVTFILDKVPSLSGHSDLVAAAATAVITASAAWLAGYWTKAVAWADSYVASHKETYSSASERGRS